MMPWLKEEDFQPGFSDRARKEGQQLFTDRKVQWLEGSGGQRYEARLPFFRRFQTAAIERESDGKVFADCSCPELENEGTRCAHVYALMLAINARRLEEAREAEGDPPIAPQYALEMDGKRLLLRLLWAGDDPEDKGLRLLPLDGDHLSRVTEDLDQKILAMLQPMAGGRQSLTHGGGFVHREQPLALPARTRDPLLILLARSERLVHWAPNDRGRHAKAEPVVLDLKTCLEFGLAFLEHEDGRLRLIGELRSPAGAFAITKKLPVVADESPLLRLGARIVRVQSEGAPSWLTLFAGAPDYKVRPDDALNALRRLAAEGSLPRLRLPGEKVPLPLVRRPPTPRLKITRRRMDVQAELEFVYGERAISPISPERLFLDLERREQLARDTEAEQRVLVDMRERPGIIATEDSALGQYEIDAELLDDLAAELLSEGFAIEVDRRALRAARRTAVAIVPSGLDWFQLEGALEFEGAAPLGFAEVIAAGRRGDRFVTLGDGSEGLIPKALAERLSRLSQLAGSEDSGFKLRRSQALLLEPFLGGDSDGIDLAALRAQREQLLQLGSVTLSEVPPGFRGELREYQRAGLSWLRHLAHARLGGILADDMGLGKTIQVIAFLQSLRKDPLAGLSAAHPHLIVAPRSLLWNWQEELARFAPELGVSVHHGQTRAEDASEFKPDTIVLTSYGTLQRDIQLFEAVQFSALVLDEAQAIKNPDSLNAKSVRRLNAGFRLSVTGTPIENRAKDLWSQLDFANPGLLGSARRFSDLLSAKDSGLRDSIVQAVRPLILRRKKSEVAKDLPERIEQTVRVGMSPEQSRLYAEIRTSARAQLLNGEGSAHRFQVLEALLRLRQVACHPGLVDKSYASAPSAKVELLVDEIGAIAEAGEKCLVFSQFVSLLDLVSPALKAAGHCHLVLTGSTKDRQSLVKAFQEDPEIPVLLISLKAGGTGLNLTAADYVFLLDPWWNPAVEAQAIDRAHRIGRTRRVVARRLVAMGTVEERIMELQAKKRELADALLSGEEGPLASLTAEDLDLLLSI